MNEFNDFDLAVAGPVMDALGERVSTDTARKVLGDATDAMNDENELTPEVRDYADRLMGEMYVQLHTAETDFRDGQRDSLLVGLGSLIDKATSDVTSQTRRRNGGSMDATAMGELHVARKNVLRHVAGTYLTQKALASE